MLCLAASLSSVAGAGRRSKARLASCQGGRVWVLSIQRIRQVDTGSVFRGEARIGERRDPTTRDWLQRASNQTVGIGRKQEDGGMISDQLPCTQGSTIMAGSDYPLVEEEHQSSGSRRPVIRSGGILLAQGNPTALGPLHAACLIPRCLASECRTMPYRREDSSHTAQETSSKEKTQDTVKQA